MIPAVQNRLGFHSVLSRSSQLRLVQEIQQEAGRQYLRHIADSKMPHLGHSVLDMNRNASCGVKVESISQSSTSLRTVTPCSSEGTVFEEPRTTPQLGPAHIKVDSLGITSDTVSPSLLSTPIAHPNMDTSLQSHDAQFRHDRSEVWGIEGGEGSNIAEPSTSYYYVEDLGPSDIFGRWPFNASHDVLPVYEVDY